MSDGRQPYKRRKIALLVAYDGEEHSGLALQAGQSTPLPTVESCLFEALLKCCLIEERDLTAIGYSRCGRTDRGVSAAGQVVALWVRSRTGEAQSVEQSAERSRECPAAPSVDVEGELPYAVMLGRVLPPSVRVLAWSPVDPHFDARFSCLRRHYKYYLANSAHAPLDVAAMRQGAALLLGEHDFRNFCKIDPSKQITNYVRSISHADIASTNDGRYVFNLIGSAFLYHQVRHIVAVLYHVGAGLERPSVVSRMLDVANMPSRPQYEMAAAAPLTLWECGFADGVLEWIPRADDTGEASMAQAIERHRIRLCHLDDQHAKLASLRREQRPRATDEQRRTLQLGGGPALNINRARYRPLGERPRNEHFEILNGAWLTKRMQCTVES